jgi:hypothetical protein
VISFSEKKVAGTQIWKGDILIFFFIQSNENIPGINEN